MKTTDIILAQIEACITQNAYKKVETDKVELKKMLGGVSDELYKSACAFLNTEGGIIILGIHEDESQKKYIFTGYNAELENKLKDLSTQFTDQQRQSVDLHLSFPSLEIKDFLGGKVCVIYVEKLDDEKKYVFFKNKAYKRNLTGDEILTAKEIEARNELNEEIRYARELKKVDQTTLEDLDVGILNDYIHELNSVVKVESIKTNIEDALSFLNRKKFVQDNTPTLLGILVCGKHIEDIIGGRCEVDGYVDSPIQIAANKQVIKDNILELIERSNGFIFKNIQVGVSHINSGTAIPEYPEKLIRETVNNALAHRDYDINQFVNIIIKPNESIEIRNPGRFRQEQRLSMNVPLIGQDYVRIRRIIPIAKARNPRLADILKTYNRWEGRGIGMASLTSASLDNQIGIPYYILRSENQISLFIPKGKTLDDKIELWLKSFSGYLSKKANGQELSEQEKMVLCYFYQSELHNRNERYTILLTADNNHFTVIADLERKGLIFKCPGSPDLYPIYLVDRVLVQTDFTNQLRELFGKNYDDLKPEYKDALQTIYQHNQFSAQNVISAKAAGNFMYLKKTPVITDVKDFDDFRRKVRYIFNSLEKKGFILRQDGKKPEYILNSDYQRTPSLFDSIQ